jgi:hypothetical protein
MIVWAALGFCSCIAFVFALFTVWWPPTQVWAVVWSFSAITLLLLIALANTKPADWLQ